MSRPQGLVIAMMAAAVLIVISCTFVPRSLSNDARRDSEPGTYYVNVKSYGAIGDNVHDDTGAFAAAFEAAAAGPRKVLIPAPKVSYKITAPITIKPAGPDRQLRLDVEALGDYASITYSGPSNSSVFITYALKDSMFSGVKVQLDGGVAGVTVWDMRCSAVYSSYSNVLFRNCFIALGKGGRNIGWRSTPGGGFGDFATMHWNNCYVQGSDINLGDIAWQNGTTNSLPWTFTNCFFAGLWRGYLSGNVSTNTTADVKADDNTIRVVSTTGFPPSGTVQIGGEQIRYKGVTQSSFTGCTRGINGTRAAAYEGTGYVAQQYQADFGGVLLGGMSFYWYGGGGSGNANDFMFTTAGSHNIFGGRFENGQRFLQVGGGSANWAAPINVQGCDVREYNPSDGIVFYLRSPVQLQLRSCNIGGQPAPFGAAMITAVTAAAGFGAIDVADSTVSAGDPFYTLDGGKWQVSIEAVTLVNPAGIATGFARKPAPITGVQTLTYGPLVRVSPNQGGYCRIEATDSEPFTISAPLQASPGMEVTFEIHNGTRRALGPLTWDRVFRLGGQFTNPAAGKIRTITFTFNGTSWIERGRTASDL
jgi:hypothetical protein